VPKNPPPEELTPDEKTKIHAIKKFIPEGRIPEIDEPNIIDITQQCTRVN
jgi:hypothetical protein